jgi:hypothetical protein
MAEPVARHKNSISKTIAAEPRGEGKHLTYHQPHKA